MGLEQIEIKCPLRISAGLIFPLFLLYFFHIFKMKFSHRSCEENAFITTIFSTFPTCEALNVFSWILGLVTMLVFNSCITSKLFAQRTDETHELIQWTEWLRWCTRKRYEQRRRGGLVLRRLVRYKRLQAESVFRAPCFKEILDELRMHNSQ